MKKQSIIRAFFISVLLGGLPAATWAFSGPFASLVTVEPGVQIDVDVRVARYRHAACDRLAGDILCAPGSGGDKTPFSRAGRRVRG